MPNLYRIYFSRGGVVLPLPVNPGELPQERDTDHGSYDLLGVGGILVPRTPKQRVVTISSYFPGAESPSGTLAGRWIAPAVYMDFFQSAMDAKEPVLYTPVRVYESGIPFLGPDLGFKALVTSFHVREKGGETGDFYYDLTLTEYRDYSPRRVQVQTGDSGASSGGTDVSGALALFATAGQIAPAAAQAVSALGGALTQAREIPAGQLVVGALCAASGPCWPDREEPGSITLSGARVRVQRILSAQEPHSVFVRSAEDNAALGWVEPASLQIKEKEAPA